ncbi:hypothetical protein [Paenibacillus amylolyticus]|uniref:hypothetical protein n=1 Tax=Paenibacillus amylolyticus TaxID=1451 RepID=UPI00096C1EF8|nr:hypothetical protein [Paenibacillus amylolyticus]OMF47704.1 hypothetical protein BK136_02095 [Paenibacillus amylolyticus]
MTITRGRQTKKRAENNFSGGINQAMDAFAIGDTQSSDEMGFDTLDTPFASTALSHQSYGAAGSGETHLLTNFGNTHLVRITGTTMQYNSAGTNWTNIAGTFLSTSWDATNFEVAGAPALIMTDGGNAPRYWNGSTLGTLGGSPPNGRFVTNDTVRVWMAREDMLYFSKFQDAQNWTATEDSGFIQYYTERGGDITALKNFYGDKYVWKRDSMAVVQGTNYYNYRLKEISNDVGCICFKTIQEVGDTLVWLGELDVYTFQGGFPVPIGDPVRKYLKRINQNYLERCSAVHDGERYYLNLVLDSATQPNIRLVYDTRYKIWRVCSPDEQITYGVRFKTDTYIGNASGQTFKLNALPLSQSWYLVTKPFDEGIAEAEKEYKELHIQGYFPPGTTLQISYSTSDRVDIFTEITFNPLDSNSTSTQNRNLIIPLDTTPLTNWIRFRISGTGQATIYNIQRYFRVCRVQH